MASKLRSRLYQMVNLKNNKTATPKEVNSACHLMHVKWLNHIHVDLILDPHLRSCDATLNIMGCQLVYGGIPMTDIWLQVQFVANRLLRHFLLENITLPNRSELHQTQKNL